VAELNDELEKEKRQQLEQAQRATQSSGVAGAKDSKDNWTEAEITLLIKAVNMFPAGTNSRSQKHWDLFLY